MKINHRPFMPPLDYVPPSHVETNDRYLAELETARRRAEKAWRQSQRALERAERQLAAKPDPELLAARDAAIAAFEARERELREIEALMRAPVGSQARIVQRAGQDDRLEVGMHKPPKRKKTRAYPVQTRRR